MLFFGFLVFYIKVTHAIAVIYKMNRLFRSHPFFNQATGFQIERFHLDTTQPISHADRSIQGN